MGLLAISFIDDCIRGHWGLGKRSCRFEGGWCILIELQGCIGGYCVGAGVGLVVGGVLPLHSLYFVAAAAFLYWGCSLILYWSILVLV